MAKKKSATRQPKALKNNLPKSASAYTSLGGKTRHYRINTTGEEISRRQYLTATRGRSNEAYVKIPNEFKRQAPRGGRGKPSSKKLRLRTGEQYGTTFTWRIDYQNDLWLRFIAQCQSESDTRPPNTLCRFYVQLKGDGAFKTKSGNVPKKGRLAWVSSAIIEISFIQLDGPITTLEAFIGDIDFPIVKKIRFAVYPVK